jgi:hypothetical protein
MIFKRSKLLYVLVIILFILSTLLIFLSFNTDSPNSRINPIKDFVEIYDYKNKYFDEPLTKFYKSSEFDNRVEKIFNSNPNESHVINTGLAKFGSYGDIFIYGGCVRDLCLGLGTRGDLDFNFSIDNKADVEKVCKENNMKYIDINEFEGKSKYVVVQITELTSFQTIVKPLLVNAENDVNAMFYDCKRKVIVDLTGTGFLNNLNYEFRIVQPSFDDWANRRYHENLENKAPLRVFKMFKSGYRLKEEAGKTMQTLRTWFREKIDFYKKTIANYPPKNNKWPIIPWVFFLCRGDILNPQDVVIIKKGKDEKYLSEVLYEVYKFDSYIYKVIIEQLISYDPSLVKYKLT